MDVVNLRTVRKRKLRAEAQAAAAESRARHGRTRAEKAADALRAAKLASAVDQARRETPE